MNQHARAPTGPHQPTRSVRLKLAVAGLTRAMTELIYLSAEDGPLVASELEVLNARRRQLWAIIDQLTRFTGSKP
jgi:hypothetical protein